MRVYLPKRLYNCHFVNGPSEESSENDIIHGKPGNFNFLRFLTGIYRNGSNVDILKYLNS